MKAAQAALSFFLPGRRIAAIVPVSGGNVNDSYCVHLSSGQRFLLQRLNPSVFPEPGRVMENLQRVTAHLCREAQATRICAIQIPQIIQSLTGAATFEDRSGSSWRLLTWIEDSRTIPVIESTGQGREVGRLLGCFHRLLMNFDSDTLHDPLPGFHQTTRYLQQYDQIKKEKLLPVESERQCAAFIDAFRRRAGILEDHRPHLRSSLIHGDPKAANFLFARNSDTAISLIDLDTVMPGFLLYDLGDCLRSCCNCAGEEINNPSEVHFSGEMFAALLAGYCDQALVLLGDQDQELLIDAAFLISFELGLRFFTDHLAGNHYFKVERQGQNLDRALNQLYLAASIDKQRSTLDLLRQQVIIAASR